KCWHCAARLRKGGVSTNAADCLIATVAMGHGVPLIHCDADFEAMKTILPIETLDWNRHVRE
ncbi:MAG: PIN domain nuclease, partial [Acidobacteriota bacterium]